MVATKYCWNYFAIC